MPRGRPASITPRQKIEVNLPEEVATRLKLYLTSGLDGKIPFGAYQSFFTARINEFFGQRVQDFSAHTGHGPGTVALRGTPQALTILEQHLKAGSTK